MNFYTLDNHWCFTYLNINEISQHRTLLGKNIWEEFPELRIGIFYQTCLKVMEDHHNAYLQEFCPIQGAWCDIYIYPSHLGLAIYSIDIYERIKLDSQSNNYTLHKEKMSAVSVGNGEKSYKDIQERLDLLLKNIHPICKEKTKIALPTSEGVTFIKILDIMYCKASGNYTEIYLKGGKKYLVSRQLKEYELQLSEHNFFRIHHSSLVHLDYLQHYIKGDGGYVVMSDNASLDVSRRRKDSFLERLGYKS
jgi:hypothetical protein